MPARRQEGSAAFPHGLKDSLPLTHAPAYCCRDRQKQFMGSV